MALGTSSVGGPQRGGHTLNPPISGMFSAVACLGLAGFRNVIPATTAATARSDVAIGPSYFVFYKGSR